MTPIPPSDSQAVMHTFFGITPAQALRVQALLRLGVSEDDVRVAERLMSPKASAGDGRPRAEALLGYSTEQMSYQKALEVLGISQALAEEERAKVLGSLGMKAWGKEGSSAGVISGEGEWSHASSCASLFGKRQRPEQDNGAAMTFEISSTATEENVEELEETCLSQHIRIQQLELQLASLAESSSK